VERTGELTAPAPGSQPQRQGWRHWLGPLAEFGLLDGSLYLLHRAAHAVSGGRASVVAYGIYAQPIGMGVYATVRDDTLTQVVEVPAEDALVHAFPRPADVIAMRYAHGAHCYAALVKEHFAGYIWVSRAIHDEDEVRTRYVLVDSASCAWDFDVYVEPDRRLGRTLGRLWKSVDERLAAQGVRWSFSRISRFNAPSISAHQRLGARKVGSATFMVCGALQLMVASLRPWLHLSLRERSRPALRLRPPH
jgi:hypothetical protein